MKPSILVIYFSQTGQLRTIIESVFKNVMNDIDLDFLEIKPLKKFPFPWTASEFFDCMPESVLQVEEEIEPIQFPEKNYDLVVLGYQPWFLSPSIPFTSFLKSKFANFLNGKNVITIIGARNMWLNAQEKTKADLIRLNANLVGNLVFVDRNPNLTSVLTIIRWTFKGQKEATKRMPEAGVQQVDIDAAKRFGPVILHALISQKIASFHYELLELNGVSLDPALVILEKEGLQILENSLRLLEKRGKGGILKEKEG